MSCPFCDPSMEDSVFSETENFIAAYNIAPIFPGHSLIIPKKHIESVQDLENNELSEMMIFARQATNVLLRVFKTDAFNWSLQDREIAGQTLAHLHLHIVLRYPNDLPDPGDWYPEIQNNYSEILDSASRKRITRDEMRKIVERLRHEARNSR